MLGVIECIVRIFSVHMHRCISAQNKHNIYCAKIRGKPKLSKIVVSILFKIMVIMRYQTSAQFRYFISEAW